MIAFLSGLELPALMHVQKNRLQTLGLDYLGMSCAGVLFSLYTLPTFGLLETSLFIAFINFNIAFYLMKKQKCKIKFHYYLTYVIPVILYFCIPKMNEFLKGVFIGQV